MEREQVCRHCATRNRVDVEEALRSPEQARCGRCKGPLFLGPGEPYAQLDPRAYEKNPAAFLAALDQALATAAKHRLRVVPTLFNCWPSVKPAEWGFGHLAAQDIAVPKLRAGQYFVDVRASSKAGGEAWATAALQITSPLRVAAVKLDQI